jgi:hypothetical protein
MAEKKQKWPSWRYGPEGQSAVFDAPEEVPEGWEDHPRKVKMVKVAREPAKTLAAEQRNDEEAKAAVAKLVEDHSQAELAEMLEKMNEAREADDQLEFLPGWPKAKLAQLIVDNSVEDEADDGEGDEE